MEDRPLGPPGRLREPPMAEFHLESPHDPKGDQPRAIAELSEGLARGDRFQVLLALAASMAFMLPVATPPNAIVFGSGYLKIPQMARAGIVMNLIAIVVVTVLATLLVPAVLASP